jgi:hypothetical protein
VIRVDKYSKIMAPLAIIILQLWTQSVYREILTE